MHDLILSKRNGEAQQRLLQSAELLARYFELDPDLVTALKPSSKDAAVRSLKEREAVADLLDALVAEFGLLVKDDSVTTVTEEQLDALRDQLKQTNPTMNKIFDQVEDAGTLTETILSSKSPALPDDLPAPVLDEVVAESGSAEEAAEEEPAPVLEETPAAEKEPAPLPPFDETPAEEPVQEEEPVKSSKKTSASSKKSSKK